MNILDLILIGIVLLFGVLGFRQGFLQTLGGIVGIIFAAILAGRYYLWLGGLFGGSNFSKIIAFVLIFILIMKIVSLFFWALGKVFRIIAIVPFLQTFEKVLGATLGITQGILMLSVVLFFVNKYPFNDWLTLNMQTSIVTALLLKISYIFLPFLPEALKKIKSIV